LWLSEQDCLQYGDFLQEKEEEGEVLKEINPEEPTEPTV
jgi:hypothetical protein